MVSIGLAYAYVMFVGFPGLLGLSCHSFRLRILEELEILGGR